MDREARAEAQAARALFLHEHVEVLAVGDGGVAGVGIDLLEVAQVFEPLLGGVDEHRVEHVARRHGNFAADDLVLGHLVALDVDAFDERLAALLDLVAQIDPVGPAGLPSGVTRVST